MPFLHPESLSEKGTPGVPLRNISSTPCKCVHGALYYPQNTHPKLTAMLRAILITADERRR